MKSGRFFLGASLVCFFVMSASFLLMPLNGLGMLPGLMFWCGLGLGLLTQAVLWIQCKRIPGNGKRLRAARSGWMTFGANRYGKAADGLFLASIPASSAVFLVTKGRGMGCYLCVAVTVFAFCLHCVFNGKSFRRVSLGNRKQEPGKKGVRPQKKRGAYEA